MARPITITITTKGLRELQAKMKRLETAIDRADVTPILVDGMTLIKDQALTNLRAAVKTGGPLPPGWEHIEDALVTQAGKGRWASAFTKVFRRKAPQAIWIEFGHRIVGHKPGKKFSGFSTRAFAFFRRAIKTQRAAVRRLVNAGIKNLIQKAAK